jgi:hypothetical protein
MRALSCRTVVFAALATALCGVAPALAKPVDLAFVNSVGGIKISSPRRDEKGWVLPVEANVAGLKTVTTSPTRLNSGLICEKTSARVVDQIVYVTVHTGPARGMKSPDCPAAPLGNIEEGDYDVYYDTGASSGFTKASVGPQVLLGRIHIMASSQILY